MPHQKTILIIAGEESGDMRAAPVIRAVKAARPGTRFIGIGGERCRAEGVELFADMNDLAVVGFVEVVRNISRIKKVFDLTLAKAREEKPDLAFLVDYPGFNLRLAVELKKMGIKVVYYVSPQVWAWKASRVKTIKKVVDRMMVLFPFEKEFYAKRNYKADFVGHPLVDEVQATIPRETFLRALDLDPARAVLGLLPGSRKQEINNHLPAMFDAARKLQSTRPNLQILLLRAKTVGDDLLDPQRPLAPAGLKISTDYYNALNAIDVAAVASGTATLETGIMGKPMVVVYRTARLTAAIVRLLVRIPYISLVNIVAGKKIVTEFLQDKVNGADIAADLAPYLDDPGRAAAVKKDLAELKRRLGKPGASQRAANVILEEL